MQNVTLPGEMKHALIVGGSMAKPGVACSERISEAERRARPDCDGIYDAIVSPITGRYQRRQHCGDSTYSGWEARGGVMLAQEGPRWTVTLFAYFGNHAPVELEGFIEFAKTLPSRDIYHLTQTIDTLKPEIPDEYVICKARK
jgi:hypothetical protein